MNTKYPFIKIFKKTIWAFILSTILVPVCSIFLIRLKTNPKDFEKFELFVGADVNDQDGMENSIKELLPEDKTVTVYYASETESLFGTLYQGYSEYCDILILSRNKLDTFTDFTLFININSLNNIYDNNSYKEYGIYFDKTKENIFTKYVEFLDDDYFLLINKNSVHTQELTNEGKTSQTKRLLINIGLYKEDETL